MKRFFVLVFCALLCCFCVACAKGNAIPSLEKESDFSLPPDTYQSFHEIMSDNIVIVEWGEKCKWSEEINAPTDTTCFAVKYLDVIEATFKYNFDFENSDIQDIKKYITTAEAFYGVEDQNELKEKYDDIIFVSNHIAESINPGDIALVDRYNTQLTLKEYPTIAFYCSTVTDGNIIPIVDGRLDIPEEAYRIEDGQYGFRTLDHLLKANELIKEVAPDFPIFESGITIEELKKYYNMASEVLNQ